MLHANSNGSNLRSPSRNHPIAERPFRVPGSASPVLMRMPRLPLLLKIAAAAAAGALAIIVAARLRREDAVASLRREIRDALTALVADDEDGGDGSDGEGGAKEDASPPPPSVLITGFRAHGKSSLVNTACRALAAEDGPLLLRAEASPPGGGTDGPRRRRRVKAVVAGADGDSVGAAGEGDVVELLDAPPLPEAGRLTREEIDAAISGGDPECVVFVLRCDAPTKERNAAIKRLPEISAAVRNKGQSAKLTEILVGFACRTIYLHWAVY